jgi:hypothetical protein
MLSIDSGGLFFLDEGLGAYAPMAISGFDETSSRRLRLPESLIASWCSGGPASVSGHDLSDFKMFFSSGAFRSIGAIRLIPVAYGDGRGAFILSADPAGSELDAAVPGGWPDIEPILSGKLRAYAARFLSPSSEKRAVRSSEEAKASFRSALSTAQGRQLKTSLMVIPLGALIGEIKGKTPRADEQRLFSDAASALARMFPIHGSVIELPGFRVGVLLASQVAPDPALILHQASKGLGRLFSSAGAPILEAERILDPSSGDFKLDALFEVGREGQ